MTLGLPDYIESKISPEPNSGCWLWDWDIADNGYGRMRWEGRRQGAHRVVYKLLKGPIPTGLQLDHGCRLRCCVNPDHTEPVTLIENVARGISFSALNTAKTQCKHGHPFAGENLAILKDGSRSCRACARKAALASYHRNKK